MPEFLIREAVLAPTQPLAGRLVHVYGPNCRIGEIAAGVSSPPPPGQPVDPLGSAGLAAFQLRQSAGFRAAKAARPHDGVTWDGGAAQGLRPPNPPGGTPSPPAVALAGGEVGAQPTSQQLSGKVAVGIVIVSGPGTLAFSPEETIKVLAEVQNGLSWLGSHAGATSPVQFFYDLRNVTLQLADDPNQVDLEGYWRNPTMAELGFASPLAYVESLRSQFQTDWGYCAFFVKYSQSWFAYAFLGGPYLCMQYANDGWGPDNIDRVFAHETGHIFNAPDEYTASNCTCNSKYGMYKVINGNCQTCATGGGVDCIMRANSWAMCAYTPCHLGSGNLDTGEFHTMEVRPWDSPQLLNSKPVVFSPPFSSPPSIALGLTMLDTKNDANVRVAATADNVISTGFKVSLNAWADTTLYSAGCIWLKVANDDPDYLTGVFNTQEDHPWNAPQANTTRRINFSRPYAAPPHVVVWLHALDMDRGANVRVRAHVSGVDAAGFTLHIDSWADSILYSAGATWIAFPTGKPGVVSGVYNTQDVRPWNQPTLSTSGTVSFPAGAFQSAPRVLSGLSSLDVTKDANLRIKASVAEIAASGFRWNLDAWADTVLFSAGANYIAIAQ